jgi:hypothetical protein
MSHRIVGKRIQQQILAFWLGKAGAARDDRSTSR